jgi:hypothetical protein
MGMITGSGQVSLLSGWIQRYQVGLAQRVIFGFTTRVRAYGPLGWASRTRGRRSAVPSREFGTKALGN